MFTTIFYQSLATSFVPTGFNSSTIIPVPEIISLACLKDYRPAALTPAAMNAFERLIKDYILSSRHPTLDPMRYTYRTNRSTDDGVSQVLHTTSLLPGQSDGGLCEISVS